MIGIGIFGGGLLGVVSNKRNVIKMLMSIELILLGVIMCYIESSVRLDDIKGEIVGIIVLTVAAGESAIGLGILVGYNRVRGSIEIEKLRLLQG